MAFDADEQTDEAEIDDDLQADDLDEAPEGDEEEEDDEEELAAQPTIEDIARELGWTPRDKWRGDPRKWSPAAEYVRKGAEWRREHNRELKEAREALAARERFTLEVIARQNAKHEQELKAARKAAIKAGDEERVDQIDAELKQVQAPLNEDLQAEVMVGEWMKEPLLAKFFNEHVDLLEDEDLFEAVVMNVGMQAASTAQAVREMKAYLKELDPGYEPAGRPQYQEQRRREPPLYADTQRPRNAGFASKLTAEEAKEADSLVKEKLFKNREEYARELFRNRGHKV